MIKRKLNSTVGNLEYLLVFLGWIAVGMFFMHNANAQVVMVKDSLMWSPLTLGLCLAGWSLSFMSDWAGTWTQDRVCLANYILLNLPRLFIGFISTLICYVLLPQIGGIAGFELHFNNIGAFITGLSADVIIHRLVNLMPRPTPPIDQPKDKS